MTTNRPHRTRIALLQPPQIQDWERGEIDRIGALLAAEGDSPDFTLVRDAAQADLVVLLESCSFKTQRDIPSYDALVTQHGASRLFCINYEDGPPGFLPGLHSSLESWRFDPTWHRSWPHLKLPNPHADAHIGNPAGDNAPSMLFTFSGACSHPLRRQLFDAFEHRPGRHKVREIRRWYNHEESEKHDYVRDILDSSFVLCPRGIASYSHRILETMALGRVPVVIADDWVPFSIPEDGYFLRVPERELAHVDRVLAAAEADYEALRRRACEVYERHFTPARRYGVAMRQLIALQRRVGARLTAEAHRARWNGRSFWRHNGWCIDQRVARRLRKLVPA